MYSAYSYVQIASYLGFASQSHFGQTFKKITGMTPKSYREAYAKEDFLNDTLFFNDD
jgi:AraC-like DNA-binding protein